MGLFDIFKKKKKNDLDLLQWQNIVNHSKCTKLTMSEKELLDFTYNFYIPQETKIIDDCVNLINNTKTIDVYFYRLDLLIEKLTELSILEKFISFNSPLPSTQLEEVLSHKEILNEQFIDRFWGHTLDSVNKLKTEKAKRNRLDKFFEAIFSYKKYFTTNNLEYINNLTSDFSDISTTFTTINYENEISMEAQVKELKEWSKEKPNENLDNWYEENKEKINSVNNHTLFKVNNNFNDKISKEVFDLLWFADGKYKNYDNNNFSEDFEVNGFKFTINMTSSYSEEPSVLYYNLPVNKPRDIQSIERPSYFPSYQGLNPYQRWIYLDWLTDITKPINIGYVFIFYYGLERHLFQGSFDKAFDMIIKLRKFHANNASFNSYSTTALILASILKKRPDKLSILLNYDISDSFECCIPEFLLAKYLFNQKLSSEDLIKLSKYIGFTNNRYIKNEYNLFKKILDSVLIELYDEPYFNISKFNISKCQIHSSRILANYSIPQEQNRIDIPLLTSNEDFKAEALSLLNGTHEAVKKTLRETRKKNSTKIQ